MNKILVISNLGHPATRNIAEQRYIVDLCNAGDFYHIIIPYIPALNDSDFLKKLLAYELVNYPVVCLEQIVIIWDFIYDLKKEDDRDTLIKRFKIMRDIKAEMGDFFQQTRIRCFLFSWKDKDSDNPEIAEVLQGVLT